MTSVVTGIDNPQQGRLLDQYAAPEGAYDELFAAPGQLRPHCVGVVQDLEQLGPGELARRWEQADRLLRESGAAYDVGEDAPKRSRRRSLDPLPLLIDGEEWRCLTAALVQRARLLNRVAADLYGPQQLLSQGLVPADWLFAHPGFLRPFHQQRTGQDHYLHLYAADVVRSPDGRFWVVADRTDAPIGAGYALENRLVISRVLPSVFKGAHVQRLAPYFIAVQEMLHHLAHEHRENPRVVLLSSGPSGRHYLEDTYLARYLGYTLVEPGDLAIREDRVLLKTLGGLLPVDVIFRRISDRQADPLELASDATAGVPGLLQAIRAGKVAVANALGTSLVESPALHEFLPAICRRWLGEELLIPSAASWWCGNEEDRQQIQNHVNPLRFKSTYPAPKSGAVESISPNNTLPGCTPQDIAARPRAYVAQEEVAQSVAPVWTAEGPRPAHLSMRVFLVSAGEDYVALPGGLVRLTPTDAIKGTKDAWVLSDRPVPHVSLLTGSGQAMRLRRSGSELPSRVADNMFWLGRHLERAEAAARLLRTLTGRLTAEVAPSAAGEVPLLFRILAHRGQIEPWLLNAGDQMPTQPDLLVTQALLDTSLSGSVGTSLAAAHRVAGQVRDRISIDSWSIIHGIDLEIPSLMPPAPLELGEAMSLLNRIVIQLAAFSGMATESMTRTQGWRFLDIGRRLERSIFTIDLIQNALPEMADSDPHTLEAILEIGDSLMTYRSRYMASLQAAQVLDLLLTDETNPRSLAWQLAALAAHVANLPTDREQPLLGAEQRIMMTALHGIRMVDMEALREDLHDAGRSRIGRTLARLGDQLPRLTEMISHRYFIHAGTTRQLAESRTT